MNLCKCLAFYFLFSKYRPDIQVWDCFNSNMLMEVQVIMVLLCGISLLPTKLPTKLAKIHTDLMSWVFLPLLTQNIILFIHRVKASLPGIERQKKLISCLCLFTPQSGRTWKRNQQRQFKIGKWHSACNCSGLWLRKWSSVLETFFIKYFISLHNILNMNKVPNWFPFPKICSKIYQKLQPFSYIHRVLSRQAQSKLKMLYYLPPSLSKIFWGFILWGEVWEQMFFCLVFTTGSCFGLQIFMSCSDTVVIMDQMTGLCCTSICSETREKGVGEGKLEATGAYRFGTERFFKIA